MFETLVNFFKKKPVQNDLSEFEDFLNTFKTYGLIDKTVAVLESLPDESFTHISLVDKHLSYHYSNMTQSQLNFIIDMPLAEAIVGQMVEISSSTVGANYIKVSIDSVSMSTSVANLSSYAIASYYSNLAASVLCSLFYNAQCQSYELAEVNRYLKKMDIPSLDMLAYCYNEYKQLVKPAFIADTCKHLFMDSEPGVYSLDVLEILDRVEVMSVSAKEEYLKCEKMYQHAQKEMSNIINLRVNGRFTYYKGHVRKLHLDTKNNMYDWNILELMLFMTAFNHRLPVPEVFIKNALKNDLVAMYIYRCRKFSK